MNIFIALGALLPFYLMGAFPTGVIVAKAHGIDITRRGSGNVGATNVARVVGKRAGVITLLVDVAKGAVGTLVATLLFGGSWLTAGAGVALVCGHCFSIPPWLRGGKGVATALGVLIALAPIGALVGVVMFAAVFWISRIVSLASIISSIAVPAYLLITNAPSDVSAAEGIIALLLVYRHKENITRLIEGREPRFSAGEKS